MRRVVITAGVFMRRGPRTIRLAESRPAIGSVRHFARKNDSNIKEQSEFSAPPPSAVAVEDVWVPVTDKASGQVYYWNTETDETTELGAPKPTGETAAAEQPQKGSMLGGLGSVMAEGFAFGVGSSVAHSVVGSIFNGGGDSGGSDGGGDDGYDI